MDDPTDTLRARVEQAQALAAAAAALAAGYALREPGALLLPLSDGVIGRLEVNDG